MAASSPHDTQSEPARRDVCSRCAGAEAPSRESVEVVGRQTSCPKQGSQRSTVQLAVLWHGKGGALASLPQHHVATACADDRPAITLEASDSLGPGDDRELRHDRLPIAADTGSEDELDDLDVATTRLAERVLDLEPSLHCLPDVGKGLVARCPLAHAAGQGGTFGDVVAVLARIDHDGDLHLSNRSCPEGANRAPGEWKRSKRVCVPDSPSTRPGALFAW